MAITLTICESANIAVNPVVPATVVINPNIPGVAATVDVGTTTTGAPGTDALVVNSGTPYAAVLDFTIPRGEKGNDGDPGSPGAPGAAATISVGIVSTGAAGSAVVVTNSGTSSAAIFNFTIPRGDKGDTGGTGVVGATSPIMYDAENKLVSILPNPTFASVWASNGEVGTLINYNGVTFPDLSIQTTAGIPDAPIDGVAYARKNGSWFASGGATWGSITGTISSQTDLQTALNAKYDASNPSGYITSSALSGYATQTWVTSQGYITSSALTPYLTITSAASTYQTISGMSSYLTTASAASTYETQSHAASTYATISALNLKAPLASPTFTGIPAAPTATSTDNSTQIATTAFVQTVVAGATVASTTSVLAQVRNQTGATLTKGTVVYISGAGGNKATVAKAQANAESTSANTYGIVQNDIADNNNGYVVLAGIISNIDTSAFVAGTMLYLSPTTAGGYTSTKPSAPNHLVYIGVVAYQHVNQGTIQMKLQNGYELDELHNVAISSVANNDLLVYESATSLWKNKSFATLGLATLSSPTFTGDPKAPTPATGDNDTSIATTAFVKAQGYITSSALSPYLLTTTAAAVYQTISGMSAYLTTTAAAGTYLTITDAASTYQTLAGMVDYLTTASASDTYYLQSNPSGYIPDAPSDSATYGRNNGSWVAVGGGGSVNWGSIGGTLSDQTDLWTVLGGKADLTGSSFTGTQYFAGSWGQVQIGDSASGIAIYDGSYSTYVGVTSSGIHFADGTSQTTAATAGANFGDVFAMGIVKDVTWTGMGWLLTCDPINSYMNAAGGMAVVSFDGSKFEWMSGMSTTSTWTYLTSTFGSTDYVYIQCFSQKSQNPVNYV